MSVSKLSQTLQQSVLKNLIENVAKDIEKASAKLPGKRFGSTFIKTTVDQGNVTRLLTDPNQTQIFGRENLQALYQGFKKISEGKAAVGPRVIGKDGNISKQAGYTALKKYLKEKIKGSSDQVSTLQELCRQLAKSADSILSNDRLYDEFKTFVEQKYAVRAQSSEVFSIASVEHGTINKLFAEYLLKAGHADYVVEFISANTDAGHLLGIFNQKLFRFFGASLSDTEYSFGELNIDIFNNIENSIRENNQEIANLNNTFSAALNLLEYVDYLSSSIKSSPEIFLSLSKEVYLDPSNPKAAVEIQIAFENSKIGTLIADAGKKLSALVESTKRASYITPPGSYTQVINPESIQFSRQLEELFKDIGKLAEVSKDMAISLKSSEDKILQQYADKILANTDKFGNILLNAEGSDSVLTAIGTVISKKIAGEKLPAVSKTTVTKAVEGKKKKQATSPSSKVTKPSKTKSVAKSILAPKAVKRSATRPAPVPVLSNLQRIINLSLANQIKQNMGAGGRRDILNLQTGRLAESAKVERMSQSREGMITAFYTYMKYPYATFSQGGRQEQPKSRDPKLLISRSIREILQQEVSNRLRAVVI